MRNNLKTVFTFFNCIKVINDQINNGFEIMGSLYCRFEFDCKIECLKVKTTEPMCNMYNKRLERLEDLV